MREIKFRAWDEYKKEMIYDFVIHSGGAFIDKYTVCTGEYCDCQEYGLQRDMRIDNKYVMQYTGLKDANGTPIYEGDIVECEHYRTCEPLKLVVEWEESELSFVFTEPHDYCLSCDEIFHIRVVGNVYENPELLKEG